MPKVWEVYPHHSHDLVKQLLYNRGIKTKGEIEKFLHPKFDDFKKELKIPGMEAAKKRILQAVKNEELVIVYGDYDADGVCGTAVLYHGLTSIGAKVLPYIPHREQEGYGLSEVGLKAVKEKGASLVITVDNGIVACREAQLAKELGLDLVITDHHTSLDEKPKALAIIHSVGMSGASVAWCLIRQLVEKDLSLELLDLVAIATVCDMMPLVGVNRALVKLGLEELNLARRTGIRALIDEAGLIYGEITAYQVGYIIGPRLNAKGRLGHSMDTLRLLCTREQEKAQKLARLLGEVNDQRKGLVESALSQARMMIRDESKKIIVLESEEWVPGIAGLIAGRLREEYNLPAVIISKGERVSKGSARSSNGLNIVEIIRKCSEVLVDVGGHPGAAGFTIETSKIKIFKEKLTEVVETMEIDRDEKLKIEAVIKPSEITQGLVESLALFEPTGVGNPKPILASLGVKLSDIRTVGSGQHLKFKADGIESIAFSYGDLARIFYEGQMIDLAYYLELDRFNGEEKLQFKVVDMRFS